jgi:hypothetical protein
VWRRARLGRQVSALPELLLPETRFAPTRAVWRLTLDAPVASAAGTSNGTNEVFVGLDGKFYAADPAQPSAHALGSR